MLKFGFTKKKRRYKLSMLQPKKQKYRKRFRGKLKGKATRGYQLAFGEYALKAVGRCWLKTKQIESARKVVTNYTKRTGKLWIRIFPDKPVSSKPSGAQMGGGKGEVVDYAAPIKPGRIIFELAGVEEEMAREAFRRAGAKLPVKTKFIKKEERKR